MEKLNKKLNLKKIAIALFLLLMFFLTFSIRFSMLEKTDEPNGLDGYFYSLQAKSFAETGRLENPSRQAGYYLCGIFAKITGEPIMGVKIWSALSSAGISLAIFALLFSLTQKTSFSVAGLLLSASSPTTATMSINYINNQTGLVFLLLYALSLSGLSRFLKKNEKSKWKMAFLSLGSICLLALSFTSHKVTLVLSAAVTFVALLPYFLAAIRHSKIPRKVLITFAALIFFVIGILFFKFFSLHSPRFKSSFDFSFSIFDPIFFRASGKNPIRPQDFEMTALAFLTYAFSIIAIVKKIKMRQILLFVPVVFFPFWNYSSDMGLRMWMNSVPLGIPLLLYIIFLIREKSQQNQKNQTESKKNLVRLGFAFFSTICIFLLFKTPKVYQPEFDPPYKYYKKVVSDIELEKDSLLIAHLGLNHVYTYEKDLKDALNWLPNFFVAREKLWRLAYGANEKRIRKILKENGIEVNDEEKSQAEKLIRRIDMKYTLIREDFWQSYLTLEEKEIASSFKNWYNPYQVRPEYIRKSVKKD